MKQILSIAIAIAFISGLSAQSPSRMSYQSVVRDSTGILVTNSSVSVRITILKDSADGAIVYREKHAKTSNANGLVSLQIGGGTVVTGVFSAIDWSDGPYFLKTETDASGGGNYSIVGTSQLVSVPYAFYAQTSGSNYWQKDSIGIYYKSGRVAIGTTPNPIVPLTILDNNINGNGNAVLHLKSNDPYHTAMTIFNGELPNSKYYSFIVTGPSNNTSIPGTFGLFNHNSQSWSYNINALTNNMAIGSTGYNSNEPKSKLHVFNGDINIDQIGSGIILKSPNGNCWRITVDNQGNLIRTAIPCP